jgi:type VI secretion system secreted protein Hcp
MTKTLFIGRTRVLALVVASLLVAALALTGGLGQRTSAVNAHAAVDGVQILMHVKAKKQGAFKGDSTLKGFEDQITVSAYSFGIESLRDPASGQPSGKRAFKPVTITKQMNQSSPQFLTACSVNEDLTEVLINFYRSDREDRFVNFYRIKLTDALVISVKQYTSGTTVLEDISFTFRKIEHESLTGQTLWSDDGQNFS